MIIRTGERIRQLRAKKNVTQEQLAVFLGVTPQAVSRWENGGGYPDIEYLPMLADFFGVTTDDILGIHPDTRAHRAEAAGVDPPARLGEVEVLRRPHLVLADVGGHDRVHPCRRSGISGRGTAAGRIGVRDLQGIHVGRKPKSDKAARSGKDL